MKTFDLSDLIDALLFLAVWAVLFWFAGTARADDMQWFTAATDCSMILQESGTYALYDATLHDGEFIPADQVIHIDAETIQYHGQEYEAPSAAVTARCG